MELRGYCAAQTNSYNQIAVRYEENEAKAKSLEHELEQKRKDAEDLLEKVAQKDRTVEEVCTGHNLHLYHFQYLLL